MGRISCETNETYHIFNRGVDKRTTFLDDHDRSYFMHLLYLFNDTKNIRNAHRTYERASQSEGGQTSLRLGERLVDIHVFALMPNHFHLILTQLLDGGVASFMQRVGTGYTMYFNKKYTRSGSLFQGAYKRVLVANQSQLLWLPHYIHMNPLSLRDNSDACDPEQYLFNYRWTSYRNYVGSRHYRSVIEQQLVLDLFGGIQKYKEDIKPFLVGKSKLVPDDTQLLIDA